MSKYRPIKINVTPEHYDDLDEKAKSKELTIAEYVRKELNIDLGIKPRVRKKRTDATIFNKADPDLIYQIAKMGNNINQIAKACNNGSDEDIQILQTLLSIREELLRLQK